MTLEAWAAFCLTEAVLCFTPGPAVVLVISFALRRGLRPSFSASLGIVAANTLYFALSATGVAVALVASRELFLVLKWVGASYLVWLGLRMLVSRAPRDAASDHVVARRAFLRGFIVQGANPKAIMFFMALLPQFIDPALPIAPQVLLLCISSVAIELAALGFYARGAVGASRMARPGIVRALERLGGGLLVAAGARLATARSE